MHCLKTMGMWSIKQPAMLQVPHAKWYDRGLNLASDTMKTEWHYLIAASIELIYNLNIQLFSFLCTERFMQFPPKLFFFRQCFASSASKLNTEMSFTMTHCRYFYYIIYTLKRILNKNIWQSNNSLLRTPYGHQITL